MTPHHKLLEVAGLLPSKGYWTPSPEGDRKASLQVEFREDEFGADDVLGPYLDVSYRFCSIRTGSLHSTSKLSFLLAEVEDLKDDALEGYLDIAWRNFTGPIFTWVESQRFLT